MRTWLRGLPGPVWTLALWMAVATIDGLVLLARHPSGASDSNVWRLHAGYALVALMVLVVLGRRTPTWMLGSIVVLQTLVIGMTIARSTHIEDVYLSAFGVIVAVLYVGLWWSGGITYLYAGMASVVLLVAFPLGAGKGAWIQVWFVVTSVMFGITLGLNMAVGAMNRQARHDPLTGLLNTIGLHDYTEMHRRAGRAMMPRSVVVIDLDGFKRVNDTQGHLAGNEVLRALGVAWSGALRPDDVAARIGGDEFLLILPQTDVPGASVLLDRLREVSPIPWSSGVTPWEDEDTFDDALRRADHLMYQGKQARVMRDRQARAPGPEELPLHPPAREGH